MPPAVVIAPSPARRARTLRSTARLTLASAVLAALAASVPASASGRPVPHVQLASLESAVGNPPVVPIGTRNLGPAPLTQALQIDVVLSPRNPAALNRYATAVSTPGNPAFHHFLRAGEFPKIFGPTATTIATVTSQLRSLGLHVGQISANHLIVPVTTTVAGAERAFSVKIDRYKLASGRLAVANIDAPRLPSAAGKAVTAVIGLDNLTLAQPAYSSALDPAIATSPAATEVARAGQAGQTAQAAQVAHAAHDAQVGQTHHAAQVAHTTGPQPCSAAVSAAEKYGSWTENQLSQAYSLNTLYARGDLGSGVTIALYELTSYSASDIAAYQSCYKTATPITNVPVDGGTTSTAGEGEAELDIEVALGIAPKAKVYVYEAPNSGAGGIDEYNTIVSKDNAQVISSSWGRCEVFLGESEAKAENTIFEQAATQGQSMLAVPGDEGSEGCLPNDFGVTGTGLGSGSEPGDVAVDPTTHTAYVTDYGTGDVSVVNEANEALVKTISLGTGTDPYAVAVDPDTHKVYVTENAAGVMAIINGATCDGATQANCTVSTMSLESGSAPEGIAVNPSTRTIYVAAAGFGQLAIISEASQKIVDGAPAGKDPAGVAVDVTLNEVYYAASGSDAVGYLSGATCDATNTSGCGAAVKEVGVGVDPTNIAVDAALGKIYVSNRDSGTVEVLDAGTDTATAVIDTTLALDPSDLAISPSGTALLVACPEAGASGHAGIVVISLATNKVTSLLAGGRSPIGVATDPTYYLAEVADFGGGGLVEIPIVRDPWDPATQPYVTGVGGTDLTALGPKPTESVWDESLNPQADNPEGAGGGGISVYWPMPSYQSAPGVKNPDSSGAPCDDKSGDCREVPDVSASADPVHGYVVYEQGSWTAVGGTSAATPLWAAITGLLDVQQASLHKVGFLNPSLYKLVSAGKPIVNDITVGNDDYTTTNGGLYPAAKGYDMASGLGSPIGVGLSQDLGYEPVPAVTSLSPATGPSGGGTTVKITGTGMLWVSAVKFGTANAKSFTVVSPTEVLAVSPAGKGSVTVTVTTPGGTSKAAAGSTFTY